MPFVSWKTGDTSRSIANDFSGRQLFPVALIEPSGGRWVENCYQGFGVFGGQDIFELISMLNGGPRSRAHGADLVLKNGLNDSRFADCAVRDGAPLLMPKLSEDVDATYEGLAFPEWCEFQGYFYPERWPS